MLKGFRFLKDFDYVLFIAVVTIFVIGLFVLYSASFQKGIIIGKNFTLHQTMWAIVAIVVFLIVLSVHYSQILNMSYFFYFLSIISLIAVYLFGRKFYGAQRWISLGGFTFQPSEFAKLATILTLAYYMGARKIKNYSWSAILIPIFIALVPAVLILKQPDLGTAIIFVPILLSMFFVWGIKYRHLFVMMFLGIFSMPILWFFLKDYQRNRLLVFINPNVDPLGAGYTITQSKIAVGSGGMIGKGWLKGTQNQLNFLPERHTDFIFSVIGEEWGFLGGVMVILLFYIVVKRGLTIVEGSNNLSAKLAAVGIVSMISFQVFVNIGMTMGFMPVVGLPLPLVSYGGSSIISTFVLVGILLNIGMRRSVF